MRSGEVGTRLPEAAVQATWGPAKWLSLPVKRQVWGRQWQAPHTPLESWTFGSVDGSESQVLLSWELSEGAGGDGETLRAAEE